MRLTKFGHACVRVEEAGQALVLDPGMFTDLSAVDGATAVLITHEHADHYDLTRLRATDAPIFTIEAVAATIREEAPDVFERVTVVAPGQSFDAGLPVQAVGELHAVIHPEYPRFFNSGYLLTAGGTRIFHPGDALTGPDQPVDVLLVPSSAPWLKVSEAIDFTREVGAPVNLAIHDRIYSDVAHGMLEGHMARLLPEEQSYVRRADGEDL
ncbi:MBL fold metallo-hydrolase [Nocardioides jensenii]|uniref:MBL fold metallo-hydrolase n=1 Tax=Nocardioides jensenii TaxID=1843 RepID=UPI00082D3C57|nr:MBL fold metallo-hydrolase [Nocardioides jensenii]